MDATEPDTDFAAHAIEASVEHARRVLAAQLSIVEARNYDFMPDFKKMKIEHYLVGVMWRFGEQFDLPTSPRDRGFVCLMQILVNEGMSLRVAKRRIAYLNETSRTADGEDNLAIAVGHEAGEKEGALATIFDQFRNKPMVSGAPCRLIARSKPIAAILSIAGLAISALIGRSWGEALGVSIVIGISTLAIARAIWGQMVKAHRP
jgi:hypothetical protein